MDARCSSRILAKVGITGTDWRLARVLGSLTTAFEIERLTVSVSPAKSGHSTPRSSPSRGPATEAVATAAFGQQRQHLENAQNLDQVVSVVSPGSRAFRGILAPSTG